jgi:hypothetical protein
MQLYILSLLFLSNLVASLTLTPISRDNDGMEQFKPIYMFLMKADHPSCHYSPPSGSRSSSVQD